MSAAADQCHVCGSQGEQLGVIGITCIPDLVICEYVCLHGERSRIWSAQTFVADLTEENRANLRVHLKTTLELL